MNAGIILMLLVAGAFVFPALKMLFCGLFELIKIIPFWLMIAIAIIILLLRSIK